MENDENRPGERLLKQGEGISPSGRVVDPSDAVTGMSFLFGAVGALIGVIAALLVSPLGWASILYCLLSAFAGGSAGVVTGGMVGAIFAVVRGVTARPGNPENSTKGPEAGAST
jgi:hypothetical protein